MKKECMDLFPRGASLVVAVLDVTFVDFTFIACDWDAAEVAFGAVEPVDFNEAAFDAVDTVAFDRAFELLVLAAITGSAETDAVTLSLPWSSERMSSSELVSSFSSSEDRTIAFRRLARGCPMLPAACRS